MRINGFHLRNYRGFRDTEVSLGGGLTVFVGPNGGGKSTLFEAIGWGFYGSSAAQGKVEDLKSWGAGAKDITSVTLFVEGGGEDHLLRRTLKGATLHKILGDGPDERILLADGTDAVTNYVRDTLLGMTREEFHATYLARQKDLEWLRGKGATDRERFIVRMIGYHVIQDGRKRVRDKARSKRKTVEGSRAILDGMVVQSEGDMEDLELLREGVIGSLAEAESALSGLAEAVTTAEGTESAFHEASQKDAGSVGSITRLVAKKTGLESTVVDLQKKVDGSSTLSREIDELVIDINSRKQPLSIGKKEKEAAVAEAGDWGVKEASQARETEIAGKRLKKVLGMGEGHIDCPLCGQEVGEETHESLVADLIEEIKTGKAKVQEWGGKARKCQAKAADYSWIPEEESSIGRKEGRLEGLQKEAAELNATKVRLGEKLESLEQTKGELGVAEEEKRLLAYDSGAHQTAREAAAAARTGENLGKTKVQELKADLQTRDSTLETYRTQIAEHGRLDALVQAMEKEIRLLEATDQMLGGLQAELSETIRPAISATATELILEMSGGKFDELILDDEYKPRLFSGPQEYLTPSGGEEAIANLAVRIAVSELIARRSGMPMETLGLDEVLASLWAERSRLVMGALHTLSSSRFEQVLLITHTEFAQNLADVIFYVDTDNHQAVTRKV